MKLLKDQSVQSLNFLISRAKQILQMGVGQIKEKSENINSVLSPVSQRLDTWVMAVEVIQFFAFKTHVPLLARY